VAIKNLTNRFTFPGLAAEWLSKRSKPHSQWRDRAGFSPDFPFTPFGAPEASSMPYAAANMLAVNSCSDDRIRFYFWRIFKNSMNKTPGQGMSRYGQRGQSFAEP
jgi:hypothetical protein